MKCVICPNLSKKTAHQTTLRVLETLRPFCECICMEKPLQAPFSNETDVHFLPPDSLLENADFAIAIGGDGTILRCAEQILAYAERTLTPPVKLVGINTGTLGFLAALEANELELLERLKTGEYEISVRTMLKTYLHIPEQGTKPIHLLNDIYASRMNGRICDFAVSIDERQIGIYRADGIIFSTPTGSTAYALSAGGPVMEPDLSLIEMNLICPHSLFARPMLFSPQRRITVTYRGRGDGGLCVHIDGNRIAELHNAQSFTVTGSDHTMPFVNCRGHAFYDALHGKLMQPLKSQE